MKKRFTKIISTLLVMSFILMMIPNFNLTISAFESTGYSALDNFINDSRYTNGVAWSGGTRATSYAGWGCCSYCSAYTQYCYGNVNPRSGSVFYDAQSIRAGDVVTVGNPSDGNGHWFVVLKRNGNSLYVAEGNYANKVRIGWNYSIVSSQKISGTSYSFTAGYHYLDPTPPVHQHSGNYCSCGYWETLSETGTGSASAYIVNSGGASTYKAPYYSSPKANSLGANTALNCTAYVTNKEGQKWYKVSNYSDSWIPEGNITYHPASDLSNSSMYLSLSKNPMTEGKENSVVGNVQSSYYTMQVKAYLDGNLYCDYSASKGTVVFQDSDVTRSCKFDSLAPGTHTIRVYVTDANGGSADKSITFTVNPAVEKPKIASTKTVGGDERTNEDGGKEITLSCATGGASIYYTTDGTEPTKNSKLYTLPFKITETSQIRARAFLGDKQSAILTDEVTINTAKTPEIITEDTPEGTLVKISSESNALVYYYIKGNASQFVKYKKPFLLDEEATITAYARKSGCKDSERVTSDIEVHTPEKPEFMTPTNGVKYAQNSAVTFTWKRQNNARDYLVNIYLDDEIIDTITVTEANATVVLEEAGTYAVDVTARNVIGNGETSEKLTAVSVAPLKVTFEDWDGSVVSEQIVDFGKDALKPSDDPERRGYFFLYWDGKYTNVTSDTVIQAVYRIRSYDVEFYDQNDNLIGHRQTIEFMGEADVPEITTDDLPEGYTFIGWNISAKESDSLCDLSQIDSDMTVKAVVGWFDSELPLITEITSAIRNDDEYNENNSGGNYSVNVRVKNYPDSYTTALLRVSLKTAEDKMVKTESRTIGLQPNGENTFSFTLNYSGTATKVEAVALGYNGDYKTGSAYSEVSSANVQVQSGTIFSDWSSWSDAVPTAKADRIIESKTLYRSRTKQTTTSTATSLDGWSVESSKWEKTGSGTHYYFSRPSGFNGSAYTNYSSSALSAHTTTTSKREVSGASHNSYIYWHWGYPTTYGVGTNCFIGDYYGDTSAYNQAATVWEAFEHTNNLAQRWIGNVCQVDGHSKYSYWWFQTETFKQTYTDYIKKTTFYKYSNWSAWQNDPIQASSTVQVETKKVYRYKDKDIPAYSDIDDSTEDKSGELYEISGTLDMVEGTDLEGKIATVMVYKGKNTDPNESQLEYVGQTTILAGNEYSLQFKTKDEPTIATGDFIVCLGVQGSTGLVNIGLIDAPVPTYTVNFYNGEELYDTQQVDEGQNAELPEAPEKEGYKFVMWSETGRNVHGDLNISAVYTPITYAVVFIDWVNGYATPFALEYGADIESIASEMIPVAEGHKFLYWDKIEEGNTTVTDNMVISAVYEADTYTVKFYDGDDEDKQVVSTQKVEYGKSAELPTELEKDGMIFMGWSTDVKWWNVRSDMDVYPIWRYEDTTSEPISEKGTYIYDMDNMIRLACADGATIYYTKDGTDPEPEVNGEKYTGPIEVAESNVVIKAIAVEENKNNSEIVEVYFDYYTGNEYEDSGEQIEVNKYTPIVKAGDEVTLNVNIQNNPGLEGYLFYVDCDPSVYYIDYIEDIGYQYGQSDLTNDGTYLVAPDENGFKVMWFNTGAVRGDGKLFSITLKVCDGVVSGGYPVSVSYSSKNMITESDQEEEWDDFDDAEIETSISGAAIKGDVTGDNDQTLADVIKIAKHVIGLSTISDITTLLAADVNNDGNVTTADVVRLARFLVGLEKSLQ